MTSGFFAPPRVAARDDWESRRLASMGRFFKGRGGSKDDDAESGIPCIRYGDIYTSYGVAIRHVRRHIPAELAVSYARVSRGDVIFAASGESVPDIGKCATVQIDDAACSGDTIVLRPTPELNSLFLAYALNAVPVQAQISRESSGTMIVHTSVGRLRDVRFGVPGLAEQAAIVKYLAHANARIDKAIAAKRRLIALLEEQGSGLRDQVLRSGDWPRRRLKTLLDRVDQGVSPQAENQEPGPGEWGVLKSGCVNGGSFRADQVKRLPDGFAIPEAMSVREGDLLVSRANGSPHLVGSAARVSGLKHQAILSDKTFRLIPSPTVDADFLALSMNAQAYRQQVRTAISGAEGLANNLPLSALKTFEFVVPPFQFQRELVRMVEEELSTLRLTMNRVTSEIALLQEFRTRLVADVVTGQVDVRAIATTLADVPECESRHLDDPIHTLESDTREDEVADE
jgi:type I restriction enzyme, S subunit